MNYKTNTPTDRATPARSNPQENIIMESKQDKFREALTAFNTNMEKQWKNLYEATNELAEAIETEQEYYDASFPPELERAIDEPALKTAWIYSRLESASRTRTNTQKKIRKALGYNG